MSDPSVDRDPFEIVAESFLAQFRANKRPSVEEYAARHPELADQIRELLPALVMIEQDLSIDRDEGANGEQPHLVSSPGKERRLGDFRILREIGRGGMGVVYEAEQLSLNRRVALKVLPSHVAGDRAALQRFRREAKAAARLHHTNIVPVFEVGRDGEVAYYAMQFIEGQGLDQIIDELARLHGLESKPAGAEGPGPNAAAMGSGERQSALSQVAESLLNGRIATERAVPACDVLPAAVPVPTVTERPARDATSAHRSAGSATLPGGSQTSTAQLSGRRAPFFRGVAQIGRQAAQGLAYAHASGIVHRDIKPSNLLLDHAGVVWITDFGLAKGEDEGLSHTGDLLGTLRYMAPERFRGEGDARADVYALGLTLYELLTLRPGFDSSDRLKLIEQIQTEEPRRPRSIDARVPRDLETIVLKAIEKDPRARYQSAETLGEDLGRFLADEPIRARQVSASERYWRWARRNPGIAVLGGVLTAVLVVATVGSLLAASYFRSLATRESLANRKSQEAEKAAVAAQWVAVAAQREAILERDKAKRSEKAERWGRYRSNIASASAALQLQNSAAARIALEDAPPEYRNWEWQHFQSRLSVPSRVLTIPGQKVAAVVPSPSGRQVAVCCMGHNEVYLYDVASGRLDVVLRGHSATVACVAYRRDSKQVATIGNDQTIRLWEPVTGRQVAVLKPEVTPSPPDRYLLIAYNADGHRIASFGTGENQVGASRLWDTTTGKEVAVLADGRQRDRPAVFSPDGKRVAVSVGEYVHLHDATTGRELAIVGPHGNSVWQVAYSPDGKRGASGSFVGANALYLWDGETGKEVAVLRGHTAGVGGVVFSPDGSRLISKSNFPDDTARLWDAATGRLLAVLAGHKNRIQDMAFSPDGARVVTASRDNTARLWDGRTGHSLAVLSGHKGLVDHVAFSPNGSRLATTSNDTTIRLWDGRTGDVIGVLWGHDDVFYGSAPFFTQDGALLVSGNLDGTVRIWDVNAVERNGILRGHESYVSDVAFSPDGEQVASAAWDGTARLWDPTTGRQTGVLKHEKMIISSVAYSRDGRRIATLARERGVTLWDAVSLKRDPNSPPVVVYLADGARTAFNPEGTLVAAGTFEGPVRLWDVPSGREIAQLKGHTDATTDVAFHPDGRLLATAGFDRAVRLWDVATRAPVAVLSGHTHTVWRLAFSANGHLLASGSQDRTIRLWDPEHQALLAVIPVGSFVYGLAFSPDGTRLAAGCDDGTIRLIDVSSRQQVAELHGHTGFVHAVDWSPDGTRLVSGSADFTVRVWDALSPAVRAQKSDDLHPPR